MTEVGKHLYLFDVIFIYFLLLLLFFFSHNDETILLSSLIWLFILLLVSFPLYIGVVLVLTLCKKGVVYVIMSSNFYFDNSFMYN